MHQWNTNNELATRAGYATDSKYVQKTEENTQAVKENTDAIRQQAEEALKDPVVKGLVGAASGVASVVSGVVNGVKTMFGLTASGGLITTPQIRSLAEQGPELVLNNSDTQKILSAVQLVRDSSISSALAGNLSGFGTLDAIANSFGTSTTPVQQAVQIEANFPNVQTHTEIEQAFNNLVNQAVQYVNGDQYNQNRMI